MLAMRKMKRGDKIGLLVGSTRKSSDHEKSREVGLRRVSKNATCGTCEVVPQDSKTLRRVVGQAY